MRLLTTRTPCRILATLGILLAITSTGCGLPSPIRYHHRHKSTYRQLYGVEEGACHGYQPTCWQQWNNGVCPSAFDPPGHDLNVVPGQAMTVAPNTETKVAPKDAVKAEPKQAASVRQKRLASASDEVAAVSTGEVSQAVDSDTIQRSYFKLTSDSESGFAIFE